jgi:DNA-binding GntR family transcriptional regulator
MQTFSYEIKISKKNNENLLPNFFSYDILTFRSVYTMNRENFIEYLRKNPFEQLNKIVHKMLEDEIISLEILPGTKLNSAQIAKELKISRTPVKEAFRLLKQEGLLQNRDNKNGYYVFSMSNTDIEDLFYVRRILEGSATYLCAQQNSLIDIKRLKEYAVKFEELFRAKNFDELDKLDVPFHKMIILSSNNRFLIQMYEDIEKIMRYHSANTRLYLDKTPQINSISSIAYQHLAICNGIESGIPEVAQNAAISHVDSCINFARRYYY